MGELSAIHKYEQRLIVASAVDVDADRFSQLRAAVGWVLAAMMDWDKQAHRGQSLFDAAGLARSRGTGTLGRAFENAVADLLSGTSIMPEVADAIGWAAEFGGGDPGAFRNSGKVIALVLERDPSWSYLRADLSEIRGLTAPSATVLTPLTGAPPKLWPARDYDVDPTDRRAAETRIARLLQAGVTDRRLAWLPKGIASLHKADVLMGSSDGTQWLGIDLKRSATKRPTRDYDGVHVGVWGHPDRRFADTVAEVVRIEHIPGRGRIPMFTEIALGLRDTPLEWMDMAVRILKQLAEYRTSSRVPDDGVEGQVIRSLLPELQTPVRDAVAGLLPWIEERFTTAWSLRQPPRTELAVSFAS